MRLSVLSSVVICLVLTSCGGSDGPPTASKSLFSSWASDDGTEVIDLTGGTFGAGQTFGYQLTSGESCVCNAAIGGTEVSATAVLSGCAYVGGGGGVDPGCAAMNAAYTLTVTGTKLTLCQGGNCVDYH